MARNEAKRQKKLMKKRRKDKVRRKEQANVGAMLSPKKQILLARQYPIHECLINPSWADKGMATILVSRRQPNGELAFGIFLVDLLCLGVKNVMCNANFSSYGYCTDVVDRAFDETPVACSAEQAHQIIYGAIDFARRYGFEPHPDFDLAQHLLDGPDRYERSDEIVFGQDGKPHYISGPHDDPKRILQTLEATACSGNYGYTVEVPVE